MTRSKLTRIVLFRSQESSSASSSIAKNALHGTHATIHWIPLDMDVAGHVPCAVAQSAPVRLIAFLAFGVALIIGLIALAQAHRKATYHGRSLLEWRAAAFDTSAGVRDTAAYALTRLEPASPRELAAM